MPTSAAAGISMQDGWLTFESANVRRRLVPAPGNWENASVDELRSYCDRAIAVGQTPITGQFRIDKSEP